MRAAAFTLLTSMSLEKQNSLNTWMEHAQAEVGALSASPAFAGLVTATMAGARAPSPVAVEAVRTELRTRTAKGQGFSAWLVLDAGTARVIASTDPSEEGKYREDQPFFTQGKKGVFTQNAYYAQTAQATRITVAAPIHDARGRVIAVIAGHLDTTQMNTIIGLRADANSTIDAFLLNTSRFFVTQPRFISVPAVLLRTVDTRATRLVLQGQTGELAATDYRAVPAFIAYRWLPEQQLGLIVKMDQAEALAPLGALRDRILVAGLLALLITSALAYALARSVTVPVKRLAADAREIGRGNLSHHVAVTSSDEIGQLAAAFAQMAGDLAKTVVSRDELLNEVNERERAEKELDRLFEVAPDMISIIGFDGRFHRLNPVWENVLGYPLAELVGRPFMDLVHPEDRVATANETERLAAGAPTLRLVNRCLRRDGSVAWFSWAVMPALDEGLFYCVTRDVTEERRAADALHESERLLRQAETVGHMGHWTLDLATGALNWSEELARIYGLADQGGGDHRLDDMLQLLFDDDRQLFVEATDTIRREGEALYEHRVRRPDGSTRHVSGKGILVRDAAGVPTVIYGTALDTTEIKQQERELEERNAELAQFTYTASHDLKSPLVTIQSFLGYLETDMRTGDKERVETDLMYMRAATDKMSRLLEELLGLSRVGRRANPSTLVSLQELVHEASQLVAGRIADRGVQVVVTDRPAVLWGDRVRLVEVFQNLLDNAVKFMGDQPEPRIDVGVEGLGAQTVFFVRDNGVGVEPQYQSRLFDLFEKLDSQTEGTGIGLALVERIVTIHGGKIWVESEGAGRGCTFFFTVAPPERPRPPEAPAREAQP
jgi:PAS domain S-box-containing protein